MKNKYKSKKQILWAVLDLISTANTILILLNKAGLAVIISW